MLASMSAKPTDPVDPATTVEHPMPANDPFRPLVIPATMRQEIVRHVAGWLPYEGCGLVATERLSEHDRGVHFFPGTNIDRSPVRYTMDPCEVIAAMKVMRSHGWQFGAIVHSHPSSPPTISATDAREAYYPDVRLIIVSFLHGEPEFGCWAQRPDPESPVFLPVPLVFVNR